MNSIETWMNSKKKTYWRIWETNSTDYTEGSYQWVLFFTDDEYDTSYQSGICGSEDECISEIKWVIGNYLKHQHML